LFGLAPGLQASRASLHHALKDGTRTAGSRRGGYLTAALVALQFTFALVLLVGSGMFLRGYFVQRAIANELPLNQVLTARIQLPSDRYPDDAARFRFYDSLVAGLKAAPGVQRVAIVSSPPGNGGITTRFQIEGESEVEAAQRPTLLRLVASPGYLALIDVPIVAGRDFEELDGAAGRDSIIVTTDFGTRFWPGQSPMGKRLRLYPNTAPDAPASAKAPGPWLTITGVSGNLEQQPNQTNPVPVVFTPYRPGSLNVMTVMLRAVNNPASLTPVLRAEMQRLDPDRALGNLQTLAERADQQTWPLRVFGTVFLIFAAAALSMASIGVYAVVAHNTGRRTQEIGIRMALGATGPRIVRLVIGGGLKQLVVGLLLGLAAAFAVTRLMGGLPFGVSTSDPIVFVGAIVILTVTGLVACWLPARRAAALRPSEALRERT
jgi:predicted permease